MRATPEKARGFNQLLKNYGTRVSSCKAEGSIYAKCVTGKEKLEFNSCLKEFKALSDCIRKKVKFSEGYVQFKCSLSKPLFRFADVEKMNESRDFEVVDIHCLL
ncbi:DgyrCDS11365 [Dimorphilus gyrociliatus]|uniref:DgyrCDS11365 n=1 Tax=Dimorphilus gyrociliatus TaxID=2664684 RepID=A0A7I8W4Z9_9ANNE|nr:DgyrCDS11365 [Dimorphilus gyrociliatus]